MPRVREFDEEAALVKAGALFWRNGYHNTSMQELVAETGVCRASLYETYGDKHSLYLKALNYHRQSASQQFNDATAVVDSVEAKLRAMFEVVVSQLVSDGEGKGCFMTNATLEMLPEYRLTVGPLLADNLDNLRNRFQTLLEQGVTAGEFPTAMSVPDTTQFLLGLVGGLNVVGKIEPDVAILSGMVETGLRVLR
jgi:TetR/AcrR family transcriptional regulator, transcriptional repressor for nem operon